MDQRQAMEEQIAYYDARADEYDEWFLRQGRYDRGPELNRQWFDEIAQVRAALADWLPGGRVLELACGTGLWSGQLAAGAQSLTLVDSSPRALELAAGRLGSAPAELVEADIFDWRPASRFDCIFFAFWLSHVPAERFAAFWNLLGECLAPGGRIFFVDSRWTPHSTARDHVLPDGQATTATRQLNDGRQFTIVKIFYEPARLTEALAALGWRARIDTTPEYFLFGSAEPATSAPSSTPVRDEYYVPLPPGHAAILGAGGTRKALRI